MAGKGIIAGVVQGSIAAELEIKPGDVLLAVNDKPVKDIIDLSFALADEYVELLVARQDGEQELIAIEKDYDEDLGLEFESAVFDRVRPCANKCLFCFVDQMPAGLRESLYVKDDDYRLSFLYGNFITLTNLTKADLNRIRSLHLSPLYVSVHATDGEVRARLLGSKRAAAIMDQLRELADMGTELHTQVVLCPGYNDGEVLGRTIKDLYELRPHVRSLAVVPVGLTRHRPAGGKPLRTFTPDEARSIIAQVSEWQKHSRRETGEGFIYLADEFYLGAGEAIPSYDEYDDFPQLENGVGLVRTFLADWEAARPVSSGYQEPFHLDVVCGRSAATVLAPLLAGIAIPNLRPRLVPVTNEFFGASVTVTGLLTGGDIAAALASLSGPRDGIIIPGVSLRKGENVFLDGLTPSSIADRLAKPVRVAFSATDLKQLLAEWR